MRLAPAAALVLVLASVAGLTGCSIGPGGEGSPIPDGQLLRPGSLSICTDASRPPLEYRARDGVLRGFEVDLLTEMARRLDLVPAWVDMRRGGMEDALLGDLCDLSTSVAIRRDLLGGRLTTFAATAYLSAPLSLLVRDDERPSSVGGLCGLRVGVFPGTFEDDVLRGYSKACDGRGLPPIGIVGVSSTPEALERLTGDRIDAVLAEHPVNDWFARHQTDRYDIAWVLGDEVVRWAIGSRPGMDVVSGALHGELLGMHHDGAFRELLERWDLDRTGVVPLPIT